jgi:hypothetical protein
MTTDTRPTWVFCPIHGDWFDVMPDDEDGVEPGLFLACGDPVPEDDCTVIECSCKICKTNAAKVGAAFPLRASVQTKTLAGITTAKGRHNLVRIAHEPGALGAATRRSMGIEVA